MTTSQPDLSSLRIHRDDPAPRGPRGRRGWMIGGGVLLAAVALFVAFRKPRAMEVSVGTATATGGRVSSGSGITANGYVVARTKASVAAKIPGRMAYLGVREGSRVRRGQILARLESADYQAALGATVAEAARIDVELAQARRDLERAKKLRQQELISDADLENAATRLDALAAQRNSARAQVALARANLENTYVRAPFDGTVLRKDAEVGEIVAPASAGGGLTRTAIVTIADLQTLEVEVDVNEAYIAQVAHGEEARITLDAYPDTFFAGRVRQVVPTADREKATVQVKVSILDRDPRILPEMGAKVEFVRGSGATTIAVPRRRVLVPSAAVVEAGDGTRVWVIDGGRASARAVEVGTERADQVEVRGGLTGGETVVLNPPRGLREGARLRAKSS